MGDHPIFLESVRRIKSQLDVTDLDSLETQVLVRLIHSSGDFGLQELLNFSASACVDGLRALFAGAPILTDTNMAAAAIAPMAFRTRKSLVKSVLDWAPGCPPQGCTRTAIGMKNAWKELSLRFLPKY